MVEFAPAEQVTLCEKMRCARWEKRSNLQTRRLSTHVFRSRPSCIAKTQHDIRRENHIETRSSSAAAVPLEWLAPNARLADVQRPSCQFGCANTLRPWLT